MNDLEQAARQALEKMEHMVAHGEWYEPEQAIEALRQALEQPKQEPVAWCRSDTVADWKGQILNIAYMFPFPKGLKNPIPLYTEQPKREWVGLTTEQKIGIWEEYSRLTDSIIPTPEALFKVIETLLKEKNA